MPAKNLSRIDKKGAYFYVFNRGVDRKIIFADKEDYKAFLSFLEDYLTPPKSSGNLKKTFQINGRTFQGVPHQPKNYLNQVELIAYSLTPDCFHLLLHQIAKGSLEKFLRSLFTRYSMYFNKKYQRHGALFEGPYKSFLVPDQPGLLNLTAYLHRTGDHSSYPEYLGTRSGSWIKPEVVLSSFDQKNGSYEEFVTKYEPDQKEKEFFSSFVSEIRNSQLERNDPARSAEGCPETQAKARSGLFGFVTASTVIFMLLTALGIRNIIIQSIFASAAQANQSLPSQEVLSAVRNMPPDTEETALYLPLETIPEATQTAQMIQTDQVIQTKLMVTVIAGNEKSKVNIRQGPTTSSKKIRQAFPNESFELVSQTDTGWYEVRLTDESTGFISANFAVVEEQISDE